MLSEEFEEHHLYAIENAKTYKELSLIALEIIKKMPKPVAQVLGPISSGGKGSIEENSNELRKFILKLKKEGNTMFNNLPFEKSLLRIRAFGNHLSVEESNIVLLEEFYKPLFESGFIKKLFFVPNWESSHGARWEHEKAKELGIEIIYLDEDFLERL